MGGSFEGILWLCQLYPNVRNLFVFNKALMIRGDEFGQRAFRPVPLFSPWVSAPPAGETAWKRERPDGNPEGNTKRTFRESRKGLDQKVQQKNAAACYSPTPSRVQYHRRDQALASGFGKGPGVSPGP